MHNLSEKDIWVSVKEQVTKDVEQLPQILLDLTLSYDNESILDKIVGIVGINGMKICIDYPLNGYPVIFHAIANVKLNYIKKFIGLGANLQAINKDFKSVMSYLKQTQDIKEEDKVKIWEIIQDKLKYNSRIIECRKNTLKKNNLSWRKKEKTIPEQLVECLKLQNKYYNKPIKYKELYHQAVNELIELYNGNPLYQMWVKEYFLKQVK